MEDRVEASAQAWLTPCRRNSATRSWISSPGRRRNGQCEGDTLHINEWVSAVAASRELPEQGRRRCSPIGARWGWTRAAPPAERSHPERSP